jgi:hypothetical protein
MTCGLEADFELQQTIHHRDGKIIIMQMKAALSNNKLAVKSL